MDKPAGKKATYICGLIIDAYYLYKSLHEYNKPLYKAVLNKGNMSLFCYRLARRTLDAMRTNQDMSAIQSPVPLDNEIEFVLGQAWAILSKHTPEYRLVQPTMIPKPMFEAFSQPMFALEDFEPSYGSDCCHQCGRSVEYMLNTSVDTRVATKVMKLASCEVDGVVIISGNTDFPATLSAEGINKPDIVCLSYFPGDTQSIYNPQTMTYNLGLLCEGIIPIPASLPGPIKMVGPSREEEKTFPPPSPPTWGSAKSPTPLTLEKSAGEVHGFQASMGNETEAYKYYSTLSLTQKTLLAQKVRKDDYAKEVPCVFYHIPGNTCKKSDIDCIYIHDPGCKGEGIPEERLAVHRRIIAGIRKSLSLEAATGYLGSLSK